MKLVCIEGQTKRRVWFLNGDRTIIGRDPHCDIVIEDPMLSNVHAEVVCNGEAVRFNDRESQNGSYINDEPVTSKNLLPGDIIRLGDTIFQAVAEDQSQEVRWQEDDPFVTREISLEDLNKQLAEAPSWNSQTKEKAPDRNEKGRLKAAKLIKNLQIVYEVGKALNVIRNVGEMIEQIAKTLLEVFPEAESLCILLKGKNGMSRFEPKIVRSRRRDHSEPFRLSRSILQKAVRHGTCIIAADASNDERFIPSQSVMKLQLRSVMCAPLVSKGNLMGVIYLDNRKAPNCFDDNDLALLSAMANQSAVAIENSQLYEEVQRAYHEVIIALMNTVDAKDSYTRGHSRRTSLYAVGIAQDMGLSRQECDRIKTAAELHDIGKIGVGDLIMGKEDPLSTMEFNTIKAHVLTGESIVRPIKYLHFALPMIRHHHEHYDGTGYPDKLKGKDIPLGARIIGAADAFDAMTTQRPYNKPLSFKDALDKCVSSAGSHFDPEVISALVRFVGRTMTNGNLDRTEKRHNRLRETRRNG